MLVSLNTRQQITKESSMRTPPRHIIRILQEPDTWNPQTFETAIRNEVEGTTGPLTASDELLISMLTMTVAAMVEAHIHVLESGPLYTYASGDSMSAWHKMRIECLDKIIKILAELALVARGRPKLTAKPSNVDELFATA
jgi:hypothetical protein